MLGRWTVGILVVTLMVSESAVRTVSAQGVTHKRVANNIWRIDGAVDVIVVQTGRDGLLMIDTGYPFAEQGVRGALKSLAGTDKIARLINTHAHHAFSNELYGKGIEIIAHENARHRLAGGFLMAGQVVAAQPAATLPSKVFGDSLRISMNGEDITLIHLPGSHTDSDIVVVFNQSNVVATGDAYVPHMPWISLDQGADVEQLLAGLDFLLRRIPENALIIPGHDALTLRKEDLRRFRAMIAEAADTVSSRMTAGMTLIRIQQMGLPKLSQWKGAGVPERLFIESLYRSFVRARPNAAVKTIRFENGKWWDGSAFESRPMYAVRGVLTSRAPTVVDTTVNLGGRWVIPGLADAHTHAFADTAHLLEDIAKFTGAGVFSAMVQDPAARTQASKRWLAGRAQYPDVAFTQGVITPSWGVIADMYQMLASMGKYGPGVTIDQLEGDVIFRTNTVETVRRAWPDIAARNDRFVKVIVAFSDEIEMRLARPDAFGAKPPMYSAKPGVTADVLKEVVRLAHEGGLLVSAHIETAADFRLAVAAGVDWIAHMPASWQVGEGTGYTASNKEPWLLTPADARAARMAGTIVVTTLGSRAPGDPREQVFREVHKANLQTLVNAGVTLAIGSDRFRGTVLDEIEYVASLGVLSNSQLLNLAASQTARLIFPELRIGHLFPGYEANFVVVDGDPTIDIKNLRRITHRVKRGVLLESMNVAN